MRADQCMVCSNYFHNLLAREREDAERDHVECVLAQPIYVDPLCNRFNDVGW